MLHINFPTELVLFPVDKDFGNPQPDYRQQRINFPADLVLIHEDKNFGNPLPDTCSFGKFDASTFYMYPQDD